MRTPLSSFACQSPATLASARAAVLIVNENKAAKTGIRKNSS
jgi:hypothetical protein